MRKGLFVLLILLTACTPVAAPQVPVSQGDNNSSTASNNKSVPLPSTKAVLPQPSANGESPAAQPPAASTNGTLWVKVLSHQDGDTVNTPTITIKGQAPADAVVTVNDDIILVSSDQSFEAEVKLDPGPNLIEIVASDVNDNEVYLPLTIDYEP